MIKASFSVKINLTYEVLRVLCPYVVKTKWSTYDFNKCNNVGNFHLVLTYFSEINYMRCHLIVVFFVRHNKYFM